MKNTKVNSKKLLLIGIGNSGRRDDGLGWELLERISNAGYDFIDCEFRYQLQVEDAAALANYDAVVFVDACRDELNGGFDISRCVPSNHSFFSTHAQSPGAIVFLTNSVYRKFPRAYILAISGKEWGLESSLSATAEKNLKAALYFFTEHFLPAIQPALT